MIPDPTASNSENEGHDRSGHSAEEALRKSEEKYRRLFNANSDAVFVHGMPGEGPALFLEVNEVACERYGYTLEEWRTMTPLDLDAPHTDDPLTAFRARMEGGERVLFNGTHRCKDGRLIPVEISNAVIEYDGVPAILATVRDLTERRDAQTALSISEKLLRTVFESAPLGIFVFDRDAIVIRVNQLGSEIWHTVDPHNEGRAFAMRAAHAKTGQALAPEDWGARRALSTGQPANDDNLEIACDDGQKRNYSSWAIPLSGETGKNDGAVLIMQDITQAQQSQEALRESELLLRSFCDTVPDPVFVKDRKSRIRLANPATLAAMGKPLNEVLGRVDNEIYPENDGARTLVETDRRVMETGVTEVIEETIPTPEGDRVFLSTKAALRDETGEVVGLVGVARDITERKAAEIKMTRSEHNLKAAQAMAHVGNFSRDLAHGTTEWSDEVYRLYGMDPQNGPLTVDELALRVYPDDRAHWREMILKAALSRDERQIDYRIVLPNGAIRYHTVRLTGDPAPDGTPRVLFGTLQDVTDTHLAEQSLRELTKRLELATQSAGLGVWEWDIVADTLEWNDRMFEMYGIPRDRFASCLEAWKSAVHPDDLAMAMEANRAAVTGERGYDTEFRILLPDGEVRWIKADGITLRDQHGMALKMIGLNRDVSEARVAEVALRAGEERFRKAVSEAPIPMMLQDEAGRILMLSRGWTTYSGYAREELQTLSDWTIRAYGEDADKNAQQIRSLFHREGVVDAGEWTIKAKDGSSRIWNFQVTPLGKVDGRAEMLSLAVDVTERKAAEKSLRDSEGMYRLLADNAGDMITRHAPDGTYLYVSPACRDLLGMAPEELVGTNPYDIFHPDDVPIVAESHRAIMEGRPHAVEFRIRMKSGAYRWVETVNKLIFAPGTNELAEIICITRDIAARKEAEAEKDRLQEELVQAQKMESVGRLAGGVAHDFNNMLGVILGHAELAMEEVAPEEPIQANLMEIRKAAMRSADLTRQLLAFARKQTISPKVIDLNETISSTLSMLRRLIGENITLEWMPQTGLWPVKVDSSQIDQVLANLSVNARDAIDGVGRVTIRTENVTLDDLFCSVNPGFAPGHYVLLAVSDTGAGMDAATLQHLFEPFFTTKGVGEGTGLGLATVYGAVRQNGGFVNVESNPGNGTTFRVYLPRAAEALGAKAATTEPAPLRGTETILLAEDEPSILDLERTVLSRYGYTVLAARTPEEALALAEHYENPIHLLVTDVVMPEMNGKELRDRLAQIRQGFKTLFMSGYTADVIASQGVIDQGVEFLQKPFTAKGFAAKVRHVLDK